MRQRGGRKHIARAWERKPGVKEHFRVNGASGANVVVIRIRDEEEETGSASGETKNAMPLHETIPATLVVAFANPVGRIRARIAT